MLMSNSSSFPLMSKSPIITSQPQGKLSSISTPSGTGSALTGIAETCAQSANANILAIHFFFIIYLHYQVNIHTVTTQY